MIRLILFSCLLFSAFAENADHEFQSFDGWWNNPTKGEWGSAEWRMGSRMFQAFGDGVYQPAGIDRPNPIEISDALFKYPDPNVPVPSFNGRTVLNAFFAQHVWHEILDQYKFQCHPEFFHIAVPPGDARMDPTKRGDVFIPFWRGRYDPKTGQSPNTPRMYMNEETSWIDASSVYGTGKMVSDFLRSFNKGRLRCLGEEKEANLNLNVVDCNFPALNDIGLPLVNPPPPRDHAVKDSRRLFRLGNKRANENPGILALQILWFREHNFQADRIANDNPSFNDDQIFFLARQRVIAEMQHVMLDEWFPQFNGAGLPAYVKFSTSTPPGVTSEFSIAFRYAETMLPPGFLRRDNNCQYKNFTPVGSEQSFLGARLCNLYWNSQEIFNVNATVARAESGLDELINGMASQIAEGEDPFFTEDVRTFAYGPLEFSRRDLMAVHIQRGRDYGLPDYNTARFNYQLLPFQDFTNFTNNTAINDKIQTLYKNNISNVDMFVGGMIESLGQPGPLWQNIFVDVLIRVRDGDRFWFENDLTGLLNSTEIQTVKTTSFKTIILRNTGILATSIQNNPFKFVGGDPCPQPKQLTQADMEACTPLLFHDYLSISFSHIPLLAVTVVLYICLVILILYLLVLQRAGFKLKVVTNQVQQMSDTTGKDGTKLHAAVEEVTEDKVQKDRAVYLAVTKGKMAIFDQNQKPVREVDCKLIERVVLSGTKELAKLLVIIPKEYDVLVCFADSVRRHEFFMALKKGANKEIFMDNGSERHVYSIMKTKDARKKELKKFFNLAIQTVVGRADRKEINLPPEIYEQELSRDEFADSFSIAKNSLFVQQLFSMVDKDGSGYVSFREFLDFMGVFYNGSSDDKLTFLFDLYDTEKAGAISRESLAKMLRSNMEISNVSHIEKDSVNQMVDAIFKQCGLGTDDKIKFKEFKEFMGKAAAQGMSIDVKSDYQQQQKKKDKKEVDGKTTLAQQEQNFDRGATFMVNKQMRDQLTGQAEAPQSYTVLFTPQQLKEIREGKEQENPLNNMTSVYSGQGGNNKEALSKVETKDPRDSGTLGKIIAYMRDNRASIFILAAYIMSGAIVFGERAYTYSITKEHAGLRRIAGFGVTTTRGAASAMMFNFALLLATMVRNLFTKIRSSNVLGIPLHQYIPFDNIYIFHKLVALVALFWVAIHIIGHFINFFHINTQPADNLACIFREVYHLSFDLPNFSWWFFATVTGFSGFLLVLVIIIMYIFSSNYSRRHVFAAFWTTHHVCAVLLYILLILHGSARLVQQPIFYIFFLPPAALFVLDQLMSVGRNRIEVPVIEAELLPSGVTKVVYKRPDDFEYKGGQWIRIACLAISSYEYHPFTLTSAPHEKHLSNHVRAVGPWTNALRSTYDPKQVRLGALPNLYLDGPYGEGHQDWNNFEYTILVGGGIGVTPFAGILKDIVHQINNNRTIFMKKCYFFWICRNQKQFEWLVDIIRECEQRDTAGILEVHIFITELQQKYDLRSTMLHVCERTFQKISNKSLFTGCRALTHFGRPNFSNLFGQLQIAHSHAARIGVFSCGPPAMTYGVDDGAIAANKNLTGPRFHHHFENF